MTDDLAQQAPAPPPQPVPLDEPEPIAGPHIQITEAAATPLDAGEVIERRDAYGRVPVLVRIRRQPPIRLEWVLIAVALGASGVLLPLFLAVRAVIIVVAIAALLVGFLQRILLRVPPGSVGLVMRSGRHDRVLTDGIHRVNPSLVLTHVITTREFAFDVPVSEVRSKDGVGVSVDVMLTLQVENPVKFAYSITTSDLDQLVHAAAQDGVRAMIRGVPALDTLDLGALDADVLRQKIATRLEAFGVAARAVAFTRVTLPVELTASLEARRLAAVQLDEQSSAFELDQRRMGDRASLITQEAEARRTAVEAEAQAEALRLQRLEERLAKNPRAARYDLELARLRVAEQLAGNTRAIVTLGANDLGTNLLLAHEANGATGDLSPSMTGD
jgi:regulator of protease activity HflC (stomatin/prohibitin superfamily)